jgi:aarF domain-containing kinase
VLAECHQRGADRLLQLCFKNGGIYTKLGQHVGQLDHLLPEEYVVTMRNNLLNRCPVTPYEDVSSSGGSGVPPPQQHVPG